MSREVNQAILVALTLSFTASGCSLDSDASIASGRIDKDVPKSRRQHLSVESLVANSRNPAQEPYLQDVVLTPRQETTVGITTVEVGSGSINSNLELSSTIVTPAESTGTIYSPINGVISKVLVDVGDHVRNGQVVAFVNSPDIADAQAAFLDALAKLSQTKAQLESVRARLELSKSNEGRISQLNQEGITAQKDVENARATRVAVQSEEAAAIGAKRAAQAFLEAARVKLKGLGLKEPETPEESPVIFGSSAVSQSVVTSQLPIRSPVTGIVVKKDVFAGQSVGPGSVGSTIGSGHSMALMTIANLKKVWVMLEVPQREVASVRLGGCM
ncbi:MAG: efflux RND transporter periplasmic adaptor subunit, partial [Cyanobacteria bacterium]|nr:efflux RND transporter periplasmic adaptor subunit [Cyanobacteriota bacterium]